MPKVMRLFRRWMKERGLTYEVMVKKTGVKYSTMSKLGYTEGRKPQALTIRAICKVYPDCPLVKAYPCSEHPCRNHK